MTTVVKADRIVAAEVLVTSPGRNYVTLKITTADGLIGWGDATLNGRELAVAAYLRDHVCPLLIGRDPARIEDTWQYLYRGVYWRRGPVTMAAIGAVDLALWDIKGKAAGQPVYQLLGGAVRDRILSYTHATGWDVPALLDSIDAAPRARLPGRPRPVRRSRAGHRVRRQPGRRAVYEPAGRGAAPIEEVWDTDAYLRHAPVALAAAREHVGPGAGAAARRAPPAEPEPGRPAGQGAGSRWTCSGSRTSPRPRTRRCCGTSAGTPPSRWRSARSSTPSGTSSS